MDKNPIKNLMKSLTIELGLTLFTGTFLGATITLALTWKDSTDFWTTIGTMLSGLGTVGLLVFGLVKSKEWLSGIKISKFLDEIRYSSKSVIKMETFFSDIFYSECSKLLQIKIVREGIEKSDYTPEEVENFRSKKEAKIDISHELVNHKNKALLRLRDTHYSLKTLMELIPIHSKSYEEISIMSDILSSIFKGIDNLALNDAASFEQDLSEISSQLQNFSSSYSNMINTISKPYLGR